MKQARELTRYHASITEDINQKKNRLQKCIDIVIPEFNSWFKTKYSKTYMAVLKEFGIEDINDKRNLVCACKSCNSSKGSKGGIWLVRGYLGRFFILWVLFYTLLLYFIGYYLIYAFNCFIK